MGNIEICNDMKLSLLSWVFDINFRSTYYYLQHHKYIDKIVDLLPYTKGITKTQKHINKYIKRKLTSKNSVIAKVPNGF